MPDHRNKATEARCLSTDPSGTVAVEYALIVTLLVFAITAILQMVGSDAMLGLPPIIDALQTAQAS